MENNPIHFHVSMADWRRGRGQRRGEEERDPNPGSARVSSVTHHYQSHVAPQQTHGGVGARKCGGCYLCQRIMRPARQSSTLPLLHESINAAVQSKLIRNTDQSNLLQDDNENGLSMQRRQQTTPRVQQDWRASKQSYAGRYTTICWVIHHQPTRHDTKKTCSTFSLPTCCVQACRTGPGIVDYRGEGGELARNKSRAFKLVSKVLHTLQL